MRADSASSRRPGSANGEAEPDLLQLITVDSGADHHALFAAADIDVRNQLGEGL